jgi:cysteine desulfuration protein SufE
MNKKIEYWSEELEIFEDMDRIEFLVELAKKPTNLPKELRNENNLVTGCMSQIWVNVGLVDDQVKVYYDSDALITKGITHVICDCFSDIPLDEAREIKKSDFESLGIQEVLSAQRRNGLSSLISTIQSRILQL